VHATGWPQVALSSQVCTPLPEHWVVPGVHAPVQTPAAHAWLHATTLPHAPIAPHVSTPLPEHWVAFGTHTPVQDPIEQA
jgi:hypothetical protein